MVNNREDIEECFLKCSTETRQSFMAAKMQGVHYIEVALNQCYRGVPAEEVIPRIKLMKSRVDSAGIQVWSIHVHFSRTLDI